MNIRRKLLAVILALTMAFSTVVTVSADESSDAFDCIQQMLNYYRYYQDDAATDIACQLYALSEIDPAKAQTWQSIMDYWHHANADMTLYPDVLPNGLPQDNSLCIVVMGYALAADGSMRSELIGRLETAYASAEKYPNAYIVCTGGGTARDDKTVTEAGKMAQWLMQKGIDKDRIIVEDSAMSTVGNARNTCTILAQQHPRVTHLALVTSDYHLVRSCLLFHAQALLSADKGAPLLCVAANAAYQTNRSGPESIAVQAEDLATLVKVPINGMPKPQLSKLEHITVTGSTQCNIGETPDLQIIAHYNTGLYRDVTKTAVTSGIDLATAGMQEASITYEENGVTVSATVQIETLVPETLPPTEAPTEVPTESPTEAPAAVQTEPATAPVQSPADPPAPAQSGASLPWWVQPFGMMAVLLAAAFLFTKQLIQNRRRQKETSSDEEDTPDLPDDDSPVEYI